jgi:dipeptidyl-peptidase-3
MKKLSILTILTITLFLSCKEKPAVMEATPPAETGDFKWETEQFADKKILRYRVDGFEKLTPRQRILVYYLTQAGLAGRDMIYDQNYRFNLPIRRALESIVANYKGDQNDNNYKELILYAKQVWFSNGIHHHYAHEKFTPGFTKEWFVKTLGEAGGSLSEEALSAMFDPKMDAKRVDQTEGTDMVKNSAVNFHAPDVTQAEAEAFYAKTISKNDPKPLEWGLNSRLEKGPDGKLKENVWKSGGMYGPAIDQVVSWLEKAVGVAENEPQKKALQLLIEYFKTGDLAKWRDFNIAWVQATEGDIDYILGFVEVYHDPMGMRGSYESIVEINNLEMSEKMSVLSKNAQWFEDNSPLIPNHKRKGVTGITYKMVKVAGESGDASPATPIGVNLPNSNWIRSDFGSKSVSLGNIEEAYNHSAGAGILKEFAHDAEEIARSEKHGELAGTLHTALHEVLGHASGVLEPGKGQPHETLKSYASALEEGRADLFALYYIMDPKLVELGVMPSLEVGKAEYDSYIKNGILLQLRRIKPGNNIEEAHMRNRAFVANWAYEKGKKDNVIEKVVRDGKLYIEIHDYDKLRVLFGELLKEVQRIKSQGDFEAGKALVENFGVKVDPVVHQQVLDRVKSLNAPPYSGFINPKYVPVTDAQGNITDVKIEYPTDFMTQMMEYGKEFGFLK